MLGTEKWWMFKGYKRPLEQIIENIKCQDKTTKPNVVTDKSLSDVFQTN